MVEFKKLKSKFFSNSGIGLVEALIAITLAIILVVSLLTLTNFNIRNSLLVTENQDAINSANQLLENLRSIKDSGFDNFRSIATVNCSDKDCIVSSGQIVAANKNLDKVSPYSYFRVDKKSPDELEIDIITEWKVGNTVYSSPLSTIFTNWRTN